MLMLRSSYNPNLAIDLGLHNTQFKDPWTVSRKAAKVIIHPQFNINTMSNDIAMVKLAVWTIISILISRTIITKKIQ